MTPEYLRNNLPPIRRPMFVRSSENTYHDIPCRATKHVYDNQSILLATIRYMKGT